MGLILECNSRLGYQSQVNYFNESAYGHQLQFHDKMKIIGENRYVIKCEDRIPNDQSKLKFIHRRKESRNPQCRSLPKIVSKDLLHEFQSDKKTLDSGQMLQELLILMICLGGQETMSSCDEGWYNKTKKYAYYNKENKWFKKPQYPCVVEFYEKYCDNNDFSRLDKMKLTSKNIYRLLFGGLIDKLLPGYGLNKQYTVAQYGSKENVTKENAMNAFTRYVQDIELFLHFTDEHTTTTPKQHQINIKKAINNSKYDNDDEDHGKIVSFFRNGVSKLKNCKPSMKLPLTPLSLVALWPSCICHKPQKYLLVDKIAELQEMDRYAMRAFVADIVYQDCIF